MATKQPLSPTATEVLEVLTKSDAPLTLEEVKEFVPNANPSHLTALRNRGLVSSEKVTKEVPTVVKRKVNEYTFVPQDETETAE